MGVRFLPLMIMFCCLVLFAKLTDLFLDNKNSISLYASYFVNSAHASEEASSSKEEKKQDKPEQKSSAKQENETNQICRNSIKLTNQELCTPGQIELLKQLSNRRDELERKNKSLIDQENMQKLMDSKISAKIEEVKAIRDEIKKLLSELEQKEDERIYSLVKIYENMKPKDAARIFDSLEMVDLIQIVKKMKEVKSAAILGQMNADKVKDLTTNLTTQKIKPEFCDCQSNR